MALKLKNMVLSDCGYICPCTHHEGTWESGRRAPHILNLGTQL